ncbi:hypothetical protein [Fischerella thermalis]|uniref:hypothetical protein n=1 Tax=Fischerella thermalis TaxID=372787 RepID=UPI000C80D4B1|nr:hypothetical protein [Fischerella thermalis]PLZ05206.1 hypothetical protein CBP19_22400 [Fischerella thermalis WC1110]PLZ38199.1 hypothetical protein CBP26_16035 [Fischerella thermalis WC538]PLZ40490.1 hypothetical protein CBP25_19155 [Fischerella thermalis WC527]PLZ50078.1 hypothetical protein CBP13_17075 [Fischerella thermalis WC441]PLZ58574.1 hypothetical protein CBP23_21605 [Fischerella thermalis WC344]
MNHQQQNNNSQVNEPVTTQEAINLLFGEGWLDEAVRIEDEANCTIGAGLDWGNALPPLMLNLPLFSRLSTLRVSLNREIRLIIETWDLGVGTSSATETARRRIKERLLSPAPELLPYLEATLLQDDLYGEEFISNREALKSLLAVLLTDSDRAEIAETAANSVRAQVMSQVNFSEKLSA